MVERKEIALAFAFSIYWLWRISAWFYSIASFYNEEKFWLFILSHYQVIRLNSFSFWIFEQQLVLLVAEIGEKNLIFHNILNFGTFPLGVSLSKYLEVCIHEIFDSSILVFVNLSFCQMFLKDLFLILHDRVGRLIRLNSLGDFWEVRAEVAMEILLSFIPIMFTFCDNHVFKFLF